MEADSADDDPVVEKIAKAIYGSAVEAAVAAIADVPSPISDIEREFGTLAHESDAAKVVLSFSYLTSLFERLYLLNFVNAATGRLHKEIFEGTGPLATSSARFVIAFALGWIREDLYKDVTLLRKIRNEFAHDHTRRQISMKGVSDRVNALSAREKPIIDILRKSGYIRVPSLTVPQLFLVRNILICLSCASDMILLPISRTHRVSPIDAFGDFTALPENMKEMRRQAVRAVYSVL